MNLPNTSCDLGRVIHISWRLRMIAPPDAIIATEEITEP